MKKNIIKKSIIITVVILITISAPLGTYHIGQQNAYGYNKTELLLRISAAIMYGVTTVQAGITNSSIGDAIESKETEIQSLVDNYVEYMMEPYQKLKIGMIADRADLIPEVDKDTYLQEFNNIPEFDGLTDSQKENVWTQAREILADGIVSPREMLEGTGIAYIYENAIKIAIEDLKENIGNIGETYTYQDWNIIDGPNITPFTLETRPYQVLTIYDGNYRIFMSTTPIIIKTDIKHIINDSDRFTYMNNQWYYNGSNDANNDYDEIIETNHDLYDTNNNLIMQQTTLTYDTYQEQDFENDVNDITDNPIPVFNIPLNPDFDRTLDPNPFNPLDTTETPDSSISLEYDPDTGDTNISQLSDSLGLLGDIYMEGANQITGEIKQTNTLLDRILGLLEGIKSNTDTGTIENSSVDTDIKGVIDGKLNIQFMKDSYNRLQSIDTTKGTPPVIYINLAQMFTAGTSQIAPGIGNPFENRDYIFIDFGYLDSQDLTFLDYTIIDYFRYLLGMGMIYTTALYLWRKIIPDKVVN